MKNIFINFFKLLDFRPSFYIPVIISFLLNCLIWFLILWRIPPTSAWIPLHYYVFFQIDWLGPWIYIFIYPMIGLLFFLANIVIASFIEIKEPLLCKFLLWSSVAIQAFLILNISALIIFYFS
jgi:hypothetical protein